MDETTGRNLREQPVGDVVDDLMKQSQEALERGAAVTSELNELKRRADNALDWRRQLQNHAWFAAIAAAGLAFLVTSIAVRD